MHSHSHCDHHHGHAHTHQSADFGTAFKIGIALNVIFIVAEVIYGLRAESLALLADAGHNASDVLGLILAWVALLASQKKPSARYTYGLQSSTILAALGNALILLVAIGGVIWEALHRLATPIPVSSITVMAVAGLGIFINGATAMLFLKGSKDDLNIRGAFLHMAADAAISAGVVISGALIYKTGWLWLDPATSIAIGLVIIGGTWALLRDSFNLALHAVPAHINPEEVKTFLSHIDGVRSAHDLHIWAMSTNQVALSVHLQMQNGHPGDAFIHQVAQELDTRFRIGHATIQIELGDEKSACPLAPDEIV